jgi:phospholipase/carboxylesterase
MSETHPPLVLAGPPPAEAAAVAVLLHGRGRTPEEILELASRCAPPDFALVAVPAPGGSYYPQSFLAPFDDNEPQLGRSLARVEDVVVELEQAGIGRERIVLLGFSQGACLACEYVWHHPARWGALIAFTGGLVGPPDTEWAAREGLHGTPVLLGTSDVDAWVPQYRVHQTAAVFRAMGAAVDERLYPGRDHLVSDDEVALARHLLARIRA